MCVPVPFSAQIFNQNARLFFPFSFLRNIGIDHIFLVNVFSLSLLPGIGRSTYCIYETEMIWRRSYNSRCLLVGDAASCAPKEGAAVQHGFEIRGLRQAEGIVVLRVEGFRLFRHRVFSKRIVYDTVSK